MEIKKGTILFNKRTYLFIELEEIKDPSTGKSIYNLAVNLPYILNSNEVERIYGLLIANLSANAKLYFEKLYQRKNLWCRAYNKDNSLEMHCTSIVENINRHIKIHVGLKCTLVEYLYRVIKFTTEFNDHEAFSKEEFLQYSAYFNIVKGSPFVLATQKYLSDFALKKLMISMMKSMTWIPSGENELEVVKAENSQIKYLIVRENEKLSCPCGFSRAMSMPCEHILRVLTQEGKEMDILEYFSQRWYEKVQIRTSDGVLKELDNFIKEEKRNHSQSPLEEKSEENVAEPL